METFDQKPPPPRKSKTPPKFDSLDTKKRTQAPNTSNTQKSLKMDLRKKENPRTQHLGFKTDKTTLKRIQEEAKKAGIPISQFIHDKFKGI